MAARETIDQSEQQTTENLVVPKGIADRDSIQKLLALRKRKYHQTIAPKGKLSEYQEDGWAPFKENSRTVLLRKEKSATVLFEDRIWALFAELGFDYISEDKIFRIVVDENGKQVSHDFTVVAADSETTVLVQSLCSKGRQKSLSELMVRAKEHKSQILNQVYGMFGQKSKIAWLFITQNIRISHDDHERIREAGVFHISDDDLIYYEQLADHLGSVARYQLLANVFKNQKIKGLGTAVPAVKGKAGGYHYYAFSIEPDTLLKIGFVLHRREASVNAFETYQRMVKKERVRQIAKFINSGGFFPNAIVININSRKPLQFDIASGSDHTSASQIGILHLPQLYHSAFIIDGQHRLYGYAFSDWAKKNTIPVVAFENLPAKTQTQIFVDINHKQKSVPRNLLMTLMAEFNWGSENADEALQALKIRLIHRLNSDTGSALRKRIVIEEDKKTSLRCLTLNYLIGQGLNKTKLFGEVQQGKIVKKGFLQTDNYEATLNEAYHFLNDCLLYFETEAKTQWDQGKDAGGFVAMNLGISALIRLCSDILVWLESNCREVYGKSSDELFELIKDYLEPVSDYIKGLTGEEIKRLRSFVGGSAVERILREFQNAVNHEFPDFNPPGLSDWRMESQGIYTTPALKIYDSLSSYLMESTCEYLHERFGDDWWREAIPFDIREECAAKNIESGGDKADHEFLDFDNIARIVKKNTGMLKQMIGTASLTKKDGLERIERLRRIGNKIKIRNEHATQEDLSHLKAFAQTLLLSEDDDESKL